MCPYRQQWQQLYHYGTSFQRCDGKALHGGQALLLVSSHHISLLVLVRRKTKRDCGNGSGETTTEMRSLMMKILVALSGGKSEELADFEAGLEKSAEQRTFKEQLTYWLYHGMKRLGFFGILFFASIPNPLFDLAGIICGNFLVPFATFFGATFLGKACIKASLQVSIGRRYGYNGYLNSFELYCCSP